MRKAGTVRKAVLPVAGLGTRFLPATKAQPKEMLPLVDKPLIQYAVEEAVASGIREIILVTGFGKESIEDYFRADPRLERELESRRKHVEAELVRRVGRLAEIRSVRQEKPLGLGHAVGCARRLVGKEPFALLLPDDIMDAQVPCTRQLLQVYAVHPGCVIATEAVRGAAIERYGVMAVETINQPGNRKWHKRLFRVTDLVEKPKATEAPSPFGVIGRYILEPEIFELIDATPPGRGGEIQLTDALRRLARHKPVYAFVFDGHHHDAGDKLGFLSATVHYGLMHAQLGPAFRRYLKSLKL